MQVKVRFERCRDGVVGPTLGPFDFIQVTYATLRIGPHGEEIAAIMLGDDDWVVDRKWVDAGVDRHYSDFIIFSDEEV